MSLSGVNAQTPAYTDYEITKPKTDSNTVETEKKEPASSEGAVYDKTPAGSEQKATYKINKMSSEDRAALVKKLKAELADRQSQLLDIVNKMINKQAVSYSQANDSFWQLFTKDSIKIDPTVDYAAIKSQAQKDIAEDGYYGVSQTAQRIFDFASALAGDDVDKMKEMQEAFTKGFKQAEKLWGGEGKLPKISYDTQDSVNKMFEDYYKSKETISEDTVTETV